MFLEVWRGVLGFGTYVVLRLSFLWVVFVLFMLGRAFGEEVVFRWVLGRMGGG